jgi:7 transmembrane sweet-taste receptor of 3 GCPR
MMALSSPSFTFLNVVWTMSSILWLVSTPTSVNAQWSNRECSWDAQCEELYNPGSKCLEDGICANPYISGCLKNYVQDTTEERDSHPAAPRKRTCNSNDNSTENCEPSPFNYHEVRIHNGNWESPIFYSWIIQILLSELLQVPTTVGMGADTPQASFYAPDMPMSWSSKAYAWEELVTANVMGGRCDLTDQDCVHVLPEVWIGQEKLWTDYLSDGQIDQVNGDGQVGKMSWYIPVHTAQLHPNMVSYHGMVGRREELASIFNRPTSWGDYCEFFSPTNCTEDDGIAVRSPADETEETKYFHDGSFTGFFSPTDKNDCTRNPDTCSGHIVGAPCSWSTNVDAQTYWNDIALETDGPLPENQGYSYGQMIEIWRAANATESHVMMWWWTPDATIEEFRGSSYEFQPVLLPEPTAECRAAGIQPEDRCSSDPIVRRGKKGGGCDHEANALQTVVASSLRDMTFDTSEVDRSPAYQAILNLKVSQLEMNTILQKWVDGGKSGYAARQAVCEWVVNHQEELESFIPRGYPRAFSENTSYNEPLLHAAIGVGGLAVLYVLAATFMVFIYSEAKVFVYAQVPFVFMVLFGLLLVACGSIFYALEPQDPICVSQTWFLTLGYTLELVPLLVKIAAINRVVAATQRMKRVRISMRWLFLKVAALVLMVIIFLTVWTMLDPPSRHEGRYLTEEHGAAVATTVVCASDSASWDLAVLCWNGILVLCATVLAFQSRNIKQEFNDSKSLGTMIYSHFVFAILRLVAFSLNGTQTTDTEENNSFPPVDPSSLAAASSFLLSVDVITAVTIYVVPKLDAARKAPEAHPTTCDGVSIEMGIDYYSKTIGNIPTTRSSAQGSPAGGKDKHVITVLPHNKQGERDSSRDGINPQSPSMHSNISTRARMGMDGRLHTDNDEEEGSSSSDDDADWGGPRFAPSAGVPRHSSSNMHINPIQEGVNESATST